MTYQDAHKFIDQAQDTQQELEATTGLLREIVALIEDLDTRAMIGEITAEQAFAALLDKINAPA